MSVPVLVSVALAASATQTTPPAVVAPASGSVPPRPAAPPEPPTPAVGSYTTGLMLGSQLTHGGVGGTVNVDELVRGIKEALAGRQPSDDERAKAQAFLRSGRDEVSRGNRKAAEAFLAGNAKAPGVITLPSGLQYKVLSEGDTTAPAPQPTDEVTVRYRASLADGTEFDRSDAHDRPATFRVNSVFKGWQQAFSAMHPGARWLLFVPPDLAYGDQTPPRVPPGSMLIYDIELLKVDATKMPDKAARPAVELPAKAGAKAKAP